MPEATGAPEASRPSQRAMCVPADSSPSTSVETSSPTFEAARRFLDSLAARNGAAYAPGIVQLVRFGEHPAIVPDRVVAELRARESDNGIIDLDNGQMAGVGEAAGANSRRVPLRRFQPGLLAGWIYVLIVSVRELSTSILLYSPDTRVVSIIIWELWENGQYVELSALGVLFILALLALVLVARLVGKRYGIQE